MFEVAARVITGTIFEFHIRAIHDNLDVTKAAVFEVVRTAIAEDVVRGGVLLYLGKHPAEIIGIEERFPTGVRGQRRKSFLCRSITI